MSSKKKIKQQSMLYSYKIANDTYSIMADKEIFPDGGSLTVVGSTVMALYCFLIAGFFSQSDPNFDIAQEIPLNYKKSLLEKGVPINEANIFIMSVNEAYNDFRGIAIKVQEDSNNDIQVIVKALADRVVIYFHIENTESVNKAIQGYILDFLGQ
ncbi:MAG: hypothetical protein Q8O09_05490 [Bacillota bacterium]|nr:hypothetical protein [Bacillota bacterium]